MTAGTVPADAARDPVPGSYNAARLRRLNDARIRPGGEYVVYLGRGARGGGGATA
jgi:hypothetical protein